MKKLLRIRALKDPHYDYVEIDTDEIRRDVVREILNSKSFRRSLNDLVRTLVFNKRLVSDLTRVIEKRLKK